MLLVALPPITGFITLSHAMGETSINVALDIQGATFSCDLLDYLFDRRRMPQPVYSYFIVFSFHHHIFYMFNHVIQDRTYS